MNATEQAALIGKRCILEVTRGAGTLGVDVIILDAKGAYGTVRVHVRPVSGMGSTWVQLNQLLLAPITTGD